jgi:hypothetical protein
VLPAPLTLPLLLLADAVPAVTTATTATAAAAAVMSEMRTSLPLLGIVFFLLLRVRGQRTAGPVRGGKRPRCEVETKW